LEVSPLFYKFVRGLIVNYYYNVSNFSPFIYDMVLHFSVHGLSQVRTSLISGFVFVRLDVLMFSVKVYRFVILGFVRM